MREYKVDVIIPTLGPGEKFHKLMQMLGRQTYPIERILIMNTEKSLFPDQGYGKLPGAEVRHLSREGVRPWRH